MKRFGGEDTIRAEKTLSFDFNPRDLVASWMPSQLSLAGDADAQLDAIFVPCRGRPEYVSRLLALLASPKGLGASVYLLPTSGNDLPVVVPELTPRVERVPLQDPEFLGVMRRLRCPSNPLFAVASDHWDLPLKRNYALWLARKHRFTRILLLDDDVRGLDATRLRAGAKALSRWVMAGFFVHDFPDTSVIGHVELAVGEPIWPFLSGSCLFVRTDTPVGPFPPIYNEDWIFMAPEIAQGHVSSLGVVHQEPYDPFTCPSLATIQEPGEIIADGLFAMLAADCYEQRFDSSTWHRLLSLRRHWLECLAGRTKDPRHRTAVDRARAKCDEITELDCVGFLSDWEHDRTQWGRTLEELK